ncbi:dimethyl-sulfide monooxygenase [Aspergillus lentulus]|uniref:Dimethyl-sulfide monooxygenase n=1 Tax=Aspergillus lentulus TaxID=293939 RepID=A0AAN4T7M3_ASPLE|nr:dimethyl-sulfide monooxygenase [Aspergillus lentulus]
MGDSAGSAPAGQSGKKYILLNAFDMSTVGHLSPGQWKNPKDKSATKRSLEYWIELAKLLERGGINALFLADTFGGHDTYQGKLDECIRRAAQWPVTDPSIPISAMAAVTKHLTFAITSSTSSEAPFLLAKRFSTLDHMTQGRFGWNIVTSYKKAAFKAIGLDSPIEHDERYQQADEYLRVLYKLWEGSWASDAVSPDPTTDSYIDPDKVRTIKHRGRYYTLETPHIVDPSPQRTPFLFQAGTSPAGSAFAATHAEAIFVSSHSPAVLRPKVDGIRQLAAEKGRDPRSIKVFATFTPILGRTDEEARAKYEELKKYASVVGGLVLFSGWTGIDISRIPLDQEITAADSAEAGRIASILDAFTTTSKDIPRWTPRVVAEKASIGGLGPLAIGSAATVADEMERWIVEADLDGFNIGHVSTPGTFEDVVELLVPELRRRGLYPEQPAQEAEALTARERVYGKGQKGLREDHPGSRYNDRSCAIRSPLLDPPDIVSGALSGSRFWAVGDDNGLSSSLSHPQAADSTAELYQPIAFSRDNSANLAALAIPPPGMGTALGDLNAPPPLNARRPAAPTLPSFELPPPNFQISVGTPKYSLQSNAHPPTHPSVNSLLTPPASTQAGEVTAPSSAAPTTAVSATPDVTPSYGTAYWQGHSGYGSTPGPRQPWSAGSNQPYPTRDSFSPSTLHPLSRNQPTSPPVTEGMTQPYDMHHLPPFQQSLSVPPSGLPTGTPQHPAMTHAMLASPTGLPNPGPSPHLLPSNDPYGPKSQSAPVYGAAQQMPSPHQTSFPPYGQPGLGIHPPGRVSSTPTLSAAGPPPHLNYSRQPWPSYSLPAMNGPVMTNIHNPNSQMSLLGSMQPGILPGFNSGHVASMQQMYGGHPPHPIHQPGPTNDRPFKCDQCPQSFNRNHDLKRHKRIHLSVKPFPCTHCDKSFSRKDALKRHILVKGCGKDGSDGSNKTSTASVKEEDKESVDTNGHS